MKPIENLKAEHEEIIVMLDVLERMSEKIASCENIPMDHLKQVLNFLEVFADRYHNGKEENYLFAAMKEAELPEIESLVAAMLSEHGRGRGFIEEMKNLLDSCKNGESGYIMVFTTPALQYINLLRSHIWKEDTVLLTMAEEAFHADKVGLLARQFEEFEKEEIGADTRERLRKTVESLSEIYLQRVC
jgi:hemerythrin-like domain-containing protein